MLSSIYYLGAAGLLLVASVAAIWLWDKNNRSNVLQKGDGESEGAFRIFYQALWVLIFWSGLTLFIPIWLSLRTRILEHGAGDRGVIALKAVSILLIFLVVLFYGQRRGYLSIIKSLDWPDKENQ